jgi:hypothetical protein
LYFLPLLQGQGSLRPIFGSCRWTGLATGAATAGFATGKLTLA